MKAFIHSRHVLSQVFKLTHTYSLRVLEHLEREMTLELGLEIEQSTLGTFNLALIAAPAVVKMEIFRSRREQNICNVTTESGQVDWYTDRYTQHTACSCTELGRFQGKENT